MSKHIRNRVTERDIRDWLQFNGYESGSAILNDVELHAIQRPGWKQLFRFSGKIRLGYDAGEANIVDDPPDRNSVWGVVLTDERKPAHKQTEVFLLDSESAQRQLLQELSADMLTASDSESRVFGVWSLLGMALFFAAVLFLIAMVKSYYE